MSRAVLSLGSNLGDRLGHLRSAVAGLGDAVLAVSAVFQTPPWGDSDQPAYLNAAVLVESDGDALGWLARARQLENQANRVRDPDRPFGPRTLDVDVVAAWDDSGVPVISDDPELTLPHPRAHLRAFVLVPMLELDPDAELPGQGRVADLLRREPVAADRTGVVAQPGWHLWPESPAAGPGSVGPVR